MKDTLSKIKQIADEEREREFAKLLQEPSIVDICEQHDRRDPCPLCGLSKPAERRCCAECSAACEAVALTETQALEHARIVKNWVRKVRRA